MGIVLALMWWLLEWLCGGRQSGCASCGLVKGCCGGPFLVESGWTASCSIGPKYSE